MIDAPLALAFSAGLVATINPCGFALLPAYLSYFLGLEGRSEDDARASVGRALAVGAAVTAGFVVVFGVVGTAITRFSLSISEWLPWVTSVIGVGLVVLGIAMLRGFQLNVALPKLNMGTGGQSLRSMFLFGVSYAVASLSCTLPVFLAVISGTFRRENFGSGVSVFLAYALGMGLVLMVLTVAIALARQGLVRSFRRAMRHIQVVSALLLIVAGVYVAYYGWYEIQINGGNLGAGGPAVFVTDLQADILVWVQNTGVLRIGLVLGAATALATAWAIGRPRRERGEPMERTHPNEQPVQRERVDR